MSKNTKNQLLQAEIKQAWDLHLKAYSTHEIARKMNRHLTWVQRAIKAQREIHPANTTQKAIVKNIKELATTGVSLTYIRDRIKGAFRVAMSTECIQAIIDGKSCTKKACKKVIKKTSKKNAKGAEKRKTPATTAISASTPTDFEEFCKEVDRMASEYLGRSMNVMEQILGHAAAAATCKCGTGGSCQASGFASKERGAR